jgi:hypothetical protein
MGLLAQAAGLWLIVIGVEVLLRLFGGESDLTGVGGFVAILMAVAGALLQFDAVMVGVNVGLFMLWGAVLPPDDESADGSSASTTQRTGTDDADSATNRTHSRSGSPATTGSTGGDTRVFDDGSASDGTRVYDPNADTTDDTRIYEG